MTKPLKEVIRGSATLLKIAEKPLGIGIGIGLIAGAANSLVLGIPMWLSLLTGSILGILVCLVASPAMKTELKARREAEEKRSAALLSKTRVATAFTAFE
jgi:membrane protein implicated in regulation of membrane protease activity